MIALLLVVAMAGVNFKAPPIVRQMMKSDAFVRVIHGPVGSGKSSGCVVELLRRALQQKPNEERIRDTRFVVVRNTYRELKDTTRKTFEQWLGALGKWKEQDFTFVIDIPIEQDGTRVRSEVLFRALDRPEDVGKLLSLEVTGAYVNELREIPKEILDGLTMRVGRWPSMVDGGSTWDGVWADTNPWAESSEYAELFANPPEGFQLFRQPSGLAPNAENIKNLKPGYYSRMSAGKSAAWIAEYVEGKNPSSDQGSVYGDWIAKLKARGDFCDFEHPKDGVFAVLDLGVSDSTAIWWFRIGQGGRLDVVDWYEASGFGASHYFDVLDGKAPEGTEPNFVPKKYDLVRIYLPHDGKQREFQSGVSTYSLFLKKYPNRVGLVPSLDVAPGIDGARWMLEQPTRFHARVADGLKRLGAYRFEWDEVKKVFKKTPLHDWTSHTADAFRYVAAVYRQAFNKMKEPPPKTAAQPKPIRHTLDEAIAEHDAHRAPDRRL